MSQNEPFITTISREVDVSAFIDACVDVERIGGYCRHCPHYGEAWSCPPFAFSSLEAWRAYDTLLLYGRKVLLPPSWTETAFSAAELTAQYTRILEPVKRELLDTLLLMELEHPGSMALSAGRCECCASCTRATGQPCRNPAQMRYSVEALGGDVAEALRRYFDETLLWSQEGHLPAYYILLGGLLKKRS